MKNVVLFLLLFFTITRLPAQTLTFEWARDIGLGDCVELDNSGNVYSASMGTALYLAKYSSAGALTWSISLGITLAEMRINPITGETYIMGSAGFVTDMDPSVATYTVAAGFVLAKYSTNGSLLWAFNLGGLSGTKGDVKLAVDNAGNSYIGGTFSGNLDLDPSPVSAILSTGASSNFDIYIAKYSSAGAYTWAQRIEVGPGNATFDVLNNLEVDNSGTVYVVGRMGPGGSFGDVDPGPGYAQVFSGGSFLAKYNSSGNYIAHRYLPTPQAGYYESALDVNGNMYLTGLYTGGITFDNTINAFPSNVFLVKFSSALAEVFCKNLYTVTNGNMNIGDLTTDNAGNVYVMNSFNCNASSLFFSRRDPLGNLVFNQQLPSGTDCTYPGPGGIASNGTDVYINTMNYNNMVGYNINPGQGPEMRPLTGLGVLAKYSFCASAPQFTATISGSTVLCASSPQTFTIAPAESASSYTWTLPAGYSGSSTSNTISILAGQASGTIGVEAVNSCGPGARQTLSITVNALPSVSITGASTVCAGNILDLSGQGATTYSWSTGAGTQSISISPQAGGAYTVTGTDGNGCQNIAVKDITVHSTPTVAVNSGSICAGSTFSIIPSGASTYVIGGGLSSVTPAISTSYTVTGTSSLGCTSANSATASVTVHPLPTITVNSGTICSGNSFTIQPSGAASYSFQGGSATVSPLSNSSYTVRGESSQGCISQSFATSDVTVHSLPVISVNSGSICSGTSFTLNPSGAASYSFQGGSATVSPLSNASYTVTGTSSLGCVSQGFATSDVTVHPSPLISVNSGSICSGNTFTMNPSGAASYNFQGGSATVSPVSNTSYTVTGTSNLGCSSANTAVAGVTVAALPPVSISGSLVICHGDTTKLTAGGALNYVWSTNQPTLNILVFPSVNTVYSVQGTDANNCQNSAAVTVTVNALPPVVGITSSTAVCLGGQVTLNGSGAVTYTWSGSVTNNVPFTPAATSNYTVTGLDLNNCKNTAVVLVVVDNLPVVTAQASSTVVCAGSSLTLNGGGALTYNWSGGVSNNTPFYPTISGTYTVTGTDLHTCKNTATIAITVNSLPAMNVQSSSPLVCAGESVTLTASGTNLYSWNTGENTAVILITPLSTSAYTVTGTDFNGCSAKFVFTQNIDACLGIGRQEATGSFFQVYPNPSSGVVEVNSDHETEISISNALGQMVVYQKLPEGKSRIDLSTQPNGVYMIRCERKTIKLIKE